MSTKEGSVGTGWYQDILKNWIGCEFGVVWLIRQFGVYNTFSSFALYAFD